MLVLSRAQNNLLIIPFILLYYVIIMLLFYYYYTIILYSNHVFGFAYAHINMVPRGLLGVNDNAQVYFFGATKNWCTASLRALV